MYKKIFVLMFSLLVASCASVSAIPPGYSGPVATVQETAIRVDSGKAKMFYLEKIDGTYMRDNSASKSFRASYGNGNNLSIIDSPYSIAAEEHIYTIVGSHVWAMDGRAILEADLGVEGDVKFKPEAGRTYEINGSLSKEVSHVWIKEAETGEIIAEFKNTDS